MKERDDYDIGTKQTYPKKNNQCIRQRKHYFFFGINLGFFFFLFRMGAYLFFFPPIFIL